MLLRLYSVLLASDRWCGVHRAQLLNIVHLARNERGSRLLGRDSLKELFGVLDNYWLFDTGSRLLG